MNGKSDREELERRLVQARRLAGQTTDRITEERLSQLVRDLEGQLEKPS